MKYKLFFIFLVICILSVAIILSRVLTGNPSDDYIPDTPQFKLPDGAKARIGKGRIIDVKYSPDGTQFAVASSTGIWFYDANTLEESGFIQRNAGIKSSISFSPDGKTLATVDGGKTIRLFDTRTLKHKATLIRDAFYVPHFVFDFVAFLGDGQRLVSSYSGRIDLWDTTTYTHHSELNTNIHGSMAFSQDGKLMASGLSNGVRIWDLVAGKEMNHLKSAEEHVESFAFSPDGQILAGGTRKKLIVLWDVKTDEIKRTINADEYVVFSIAFSPDGKTLASGSTDNSVKLWDVASGKLKKTLKRHSRSIQKVLFSPNGKTLISCCRHSIIYLWDVETGEHKDTLNDHRDLTTSISLSPDGLTIASGSRDNTVRLWDTNTGKHQMIIKGHKSVVTSVSFSPDGLTLASGSRDRTIQMWDVRMGKRKNILKGHKREINTVRYSPDGNHIASLTHGSFWVWDVSTGKRKLNVTGYQSNYINNSIAFSPDGSLLAVRGKDATILLWDVAKGKSKRTFKWNAMSMTFSPDGNYLASSSHYMNKNIRFWNVDNGEVVKTIPVDYPQETYINGLVTSLTYTPDGKYILLGCQDGTIRILDPTTGEKIKSIKAHGSQVNDMLFSEDGTTLISLSAYASVLVWDFASILETIHTKN